MTTSRRILLFVLFTMSAAAQGSDSAAALLRSVQKKYSSVEDASAQFVQTVTLRFGTPRSQSGSVMIKKGNRYRLETGGQLLVADGRTVWIVSKEGNQVLIDAFKANDKVFSPDKFLLGLPDDFSAAEMKDDSGLLKVSLKPRRSNAQTRQIVSLTAWINPRSLTIEKVDYTDRNRARYVISLSGLRFDQNIPERLFRFDPPQGMKVIDLRSLK